MYILSCDDVNIHSFIYYDVQKNLKFQCSNNICELRYFSFRSYSSVGYVTVLVRKRFAVQTHLRLVKFSIFIKIQRQRLLENQENLDRTKMLLSYLTCFYHKFIIAIFFFLKKCKYIST